MFPETCIQKALFSTKRRLLPLGIIKISALLAVTGAALYGQTGTIVGEVADASRATIAGAVVRLTSPGTSATRDVKTNSAGAFQLPNVLPGEYSLKITADGFKTFEVSDIQRPEPKSAIWERFNCNWAL